jgi:alpha-mannosidase
MNLTLLRSPNWPDDRADEGIHEFSYAVHAWNEGFTSNPVIREAYELNSPIVSARGATDRMPSLIECDRANVIVDTVKLAEDGSGDWIARLYESKGMSTRCTVATGVDVAGAHATDMLETSSAEELAVISSGSDHDGNRRFVLTFKPFEVKTIRFSSRR